MSDDWGDELTLAAQRLDEDVLLFLLTKKPPTLVGKRCQQEREAGPDGDRRIERCKRPVWGDGRVDGEFYGFCSRCWHEHNAFHGHYTTMQANPAAAKLDGTGIQRLTFGATLPDAPPEDWQ
jgi:hypothetical protein